MGGIPFITDFMETVDGLQKYADPRTKDWFVLFGSPVPVWIITAIYVIGVTYVGPKFMENRKPYSLQTFMIIYNIGLVFGSLYLFLEIMLSTSAAGYGWLCSPYNKNTPKNPLELRVANVLWWYCFSKVIEFLDTILMVLRKKQSQVTVLHVFHHASILHISWWLVTFMPGGQTWVSFCLNSLVHVVMYSYYGLCLMPSLKDKLWWKKYITTFQLVQFVIILFHIVQSYTSGCDYPVWGVCMIAIYMGFMLVLFGNFYIASYKVKRRSARGKRISSAIAADINANQNGIAAESAVSDRQRHESKNIKQRH